MKFGAIKIVCITLLIDLLIDEFNNSATIIGKGNPMIKPSMFKIKVFAISCQKFVAPKNMEKFCQPIHIVFADKKSSPGT